MTLIPGLPSKAGAVAGGAPKDQATARSGGALPATAATNGAACEMAREMVAAGCPDQPWKARNAEGRRTVYGSSLAALARTAIDANCRFVRWHRYPDNAHQEAA
jgi:hypothetical protein